MLITPAYAQSLVDSAGGMVQLLPLILIFVVFYFFLIRPQQQRAKQHKATLESLRRGDRVVTGGGIIGTVAKVVGDSEVAVDIAENVRVRVMRSTITQVLAKTEPAGKGKEKEKEAEAAGEKEADAAKGG
ncbi:MAG TPA: preprotein translocase subunit YajC [Stellaceae bacterium]|nr:preprotein translocase subunit YajC [Stellaceae bacterium]